MSTRQFLNEEDAARHIGMSVSFLRMARCRGVLGNRTTPPPYHKIGSAIRYDLTDLDAWLAACRVDPATRRANQHSKPADGRTA